MAFPKAVQGYSRPALRRPGTGGLEIVFREGERYGESGMQIKTEVSLFDLFRFPDGCLVAGEPTGRAGGRAPRHRRPETLSSTSLKEIFPNKIGSSRIYSPVRISSGCFIATLRANYSSGSCGTMIGRLAGRHSISSGKSGPFSPSMSVVGWSFSICSRRVWK